MCIVNERISPYYQLIGLLVNVNPVPGMPGLLDVHAPGLIFLPVPLYLQHYHKRGSLPYLPLLSPALSNTQQTYETEMMPFPKL
jgi:hypothetical protein